MQLTYTELVKLASTETTYEKHYRDYIKENPKDPNGNDFCYEDQADEMDSREAYDTGEDDGKILMARRVCNMLGLTYELPAGFKDSLYP